MGRVLFLLPMNHGDYLFSELLNPVFSVDGENVKVKVAVKFLDNQTKATQVSQYNLTLHKDRNWRIVYAESNREISKR